MNEAGIPQLEVAEILDTTTIVVAGTGVTRLAENEELWIVGVGPIVRMTNLPLVIPKRTVTVTMVAPTYVIARPEAVEQEVAVGSAFVTPFQPTTKTVVRRPPLQVDEKAIAGNPGATPVRVGDPVVRPRDIKAYILALAQEKTTG